MILYFIEDNGKATIIQSRYTLQTHKPHFAKFIVVLFYFHYIKKDKIIAKT